ncbi:hypothetical protein T06_6163 [Trichinella sp. T6]|nr:hypothetical protein T06_6163 [Trichinella sp. T6]
MVSDCHIYKYKEPHIFSFFTISREIRNRGTWDQTHCYYAISDINQILYINHCHDLETCNKKVACGKYNSTFECRLFLKGASNKQKKYKIKDMHHTNVRITGTIRRNPQITTISYKLIHLHMEKTTTVAEIVY